MSNEKLLATTVMDDGVIELSSTCESPPAGQPSPEKTVDQAASFDDLELSQFGLNVPDSWLSSESVDSIKRRGIDMFSKSDDAAMLLKNELTDLKESETAANSNANNADDSTGTGADAIKIKHMEEAEQQDGFSLQGMVGKYWNEAKKDPALRQQYEQVGKSYKAQREFRMKWLKTTLETITKKKPKSRSRRRSQKIRVPMSPSTSLSIGRAERDDPKQSQLPSATRFVASSFTKLARKLALERLGFYSIA